MTSWDWVPLDDFVSDRIKTLKKTICGVLRKDKEGSQSYARNGKGACVACLESILPR
jgi:hypothetical protein